MAHRNVIVEVTTKLSIQIDDGVEVDQFIQELEYDFTDGTGQATVLDTEIINHEVRDSK